jgi:hypothetical protein
VSSLHILFRNCLALLAKSCHNGNICKCIPKKLDSSLAVGLFSVTTTLQAISTYNGIIVQPVNEWFESQPGNSKCCEPTSSCHVRPSDIRTFPWLGQRAFNNLLALEEFGDEPSKEQCQTNKCCRKKAGTLLQK